jgi:F-type H+-transporting ATPase subunit b
MLIDWFTVIAQAVNFLILIWLLKRFLYKPILNAIDQRENKIKNQIKEAENKVVEAEKEQKEFQEKNEAFEAQRESLLNKAGEEAAAKRKQLLEDARKEAEDLRGRLEQSIREEQQHLSREILERTQKEIFAIARKVLADLASASLEEHMVRVFLRHLDEQKKQLAEALGPPSGEILVRSAFELPQQLRVDIESAVGEVAADNIHCRFETAPGQISGIELTAGGYKVAWSVEDYLRSLEERLNELIGEEADLQYQPTTKTAADESTT